MDHLIKWLLKGDVAIQYQVHRDLLGFKYASLQDRIAREGWGARFLSARKQEGHWGQRFYQPKWISTNYSVLDLKNLGIAQDCQPIRESIAQVLDTLKGSDGGVSPFTAAQKCDVCVNGMFLNYAAYFKLPQDSLSSIIDFLLTEHMKDGGFNCESNFGGASHSSVHSTISVLEGIHEYSVNGYTYKLDELQKVKQECVEFLLEHRLYQSHRTGETIDKKMLMLSYPSRWKYDILRSLDYMQMAGVAYDPRMQAALDILLKKRLKDGKWPNQARHPGQTHFDMEKTGSPSRWNTLRALRVLNYYDQNTAQI